MSGAKEGAEGQGESNPLGMSDADFLKAPAPEDGPAPEPEEKGDGNAGEDKGEEPPDPADPAEPETPKDPGEPEAKTKAEGEEEAPPLGSEAAKPAAKEDAKGKPAKAEKAPKEAPKEAAEKAPGTTQEAAGAPPAPTPEAMAEFYQRVVQTPLKANGKEIRINTPEEAIGLMQMGANYTRKLQALAPHRKVVAMLEKNDLLDEGKLAFLIDISNKNPDAIRKLVKDSGIDPSEIDLDSKADYVPGNHRVSDTEVRFRGAMDDLKSTPEGKETLRLIHTDWDDASKDMLWENPDVLGIIHQQRENGVYARISAEVDRQRTLGLLGAEIPFLHAYKHVGDQLMASTQGQAPGASTIKAPGPGPTGQPVVVAARTAAPRPQVRNSDKAAAAMGSRAAPKTTSARPNPLAMSDDDFVKSMENRL